MGSEGSLESYKHLHLGIFHYPDKNPIFSENPDYSLIRIFTIRTKNAGTKRDRINEV